MNSFDFNERVSAMTAYQDARHQQEFAEMQELYDNHKQPPKKQQQQQGSVWLPVIAVLLGLLVVIQARAFWYTDYRLEKINDNIRFQHFNEQRDKAKIDEILKR